MCCDRRGLVHVDDAGPQTVTQVGGQGVDRALVGIERDGEIAAVGQPEGLVEAALERRRLVAPVLGDLDVAVLVREVRPGQVRRIRVALHLGERDRRLRELAAREADAVERVLPAPVSYTHLTLPTIYSV